MKYHYLLITSIEDLSSIKSFSSLRQLCDEHGINYGNADYHINRKKDGNGTYTHKTGGVSEPEAKVVKVEHVAGLSRGTDNFKK